MKKNNPIYLFVLPSQNKNNTYIELLLNSVNYNPVVVEKTAEDSMIGVFSKILSQKDRHINNVIHIQWPTVLYGSKYILKSLFLLMINSSLILILKLFTKTKVVWTMHNFFAHDYPHPLVDALGMKIISALSDAIVVQTKSGIDIRRNKKMIYIPHGHYIGVYGDKREKDNILKRELGFKDSDIVLLSLGAIAPYKKNEKIIEIVEKLSQTHLNLKLLICDKGNREYVESLGGGVSFLVQNKFIPDNELSRYLSIADYSVFYYDDSEMTSGGIILSLSYGVPVITRNIPTSELISPTNGFIFANDAELESILTEISSVTLNKNDAIKSVEGYDWDSVGKQYINLYKSIWNL